MLTTEQVQQFKDEGYLALPDFFTADEIKAMLAELERFKQEGLGRNVATDGDGETTSTTQINYQIIPLNDKSTLFRAMPFHPKIIAYLGQLIGTPFVRYKQTFAHDRDPNSDHHIHTEVDDREAVAVELPAGGAVFFNYGTAHGTRSNQTDKERAGLAFHFLRTDYIPEHYGNDALAGFVHLCGPEATGGEAEYGQVIDGTWDAEVQALL